MPKQRLHVEEFEQRYKRDAKEWGSGLGQPMAIPGGYLPDKSPTQIFKTQGPKTRTYTQTEAANVPLVTTARSLQLLPANPDRNYLLIQNRGIASVFIAFDRLAAISNGIEIAGGGFYEPFSAPRNSVNVISAVPGQLVIAIDGVI